jgi:HTH-type transcriptional regulator/antitoxin HigA
MKSQVYIRSFLTHKEYDNRSKWDRRFLTLLVERYEQEHYSIPAADPVSVVRFLIEQQNLTQRDLIFQFGSESAVSLSWPGNGISP